MDTLSAGAVVPSKPHESDAVVVEAQAVNPCQRTVCDLGYHHFMLRYDIEKGKTVEFCQDCGLER